MKVTTHEIQWHQKLPIFSVDFEPPQPSQTSSSSSSLSPTLPPGQGLSTVVDHGSCRFATAGGDQVVRVWRLSDGPAAKIEFLAELCNRFEPGVVNCVRWSPSGGALNVWSEVQSGDQSAMEVDDVEQKEHWRILKTFRGSASDMYDLAWSFDGRYIAVGCLDHSCLVWAVEENQCIQKITEHSYFVQGLAFDPLGHYLASQSGDRSLNVYKQTAVGKRVAFSLLARHLNATVPKCSKSEPDGAAKESEDPKPDANLVGTDNACDGPPQPNELASVRLFHDETLPSFFRRLAFSPDGSILAAPAGLIEGDGEGEQSTLRYAVHIFNRGDIGR
ncbi:Chromatin assembly factor 1 subunit B [Cladochytrium tenue]|nr:Chromatin assembly factor 1 subunit B [Cladochytrium tenue]